MPRHLLKIAHCVLIIVIEGNYNRIYKLIHNFDLYVFELQIIQVLITLNGFSYFWHFMITSNLRLHLAIHGNLMVSFHVYKSIFDKNRLLLL